MQRKLGSFEQAWLITEAFTPTTVVAVLKIRGSLRPAILEQALLALRRRHPLLRSRIVGRDKNAHLHIGDAPPPPLEVIPREDDRQWLRLAEDRLNHTFNNETGPLARCDYLHPGPAGRDGEILLTFSHVIVDGDSGVNLLRELLRYCTAGERGIPLPDDPPLTLQPPVEALLPPGYRGFRQWGAKLRFMMDQMGDEMRYRWGSRHCRKPPVHTAARCRILTMSLSPAATNQLVRRSRRARVTLNSALGAAMLMAVGERFYGERATPLRHITFSGLRPYLDPPLPDMHLGCYIAMTRLTVTVHPDQDIWALSRELSARFHRAARKGFKYVGVTLSKTLMRMVVGQRSFRMGATALSYMGAVDLGGEDGPIRARGLHTFVTNFTLGPEYAAMARIFAGRLTCDLLYLDADMDHAAAREIADRTRRILETAAADHAPEETR
ncbi:MAG: hypothetical protein GY859_25150 [Desulfobacterales bacterium]|nr:hypothetical protein [Desulfobacterales bacterium]